MLLVLHVADENIKHGLVAKKAVHQKKTKTFFQFLKVSLVNNENCPEKDVLIFAFDCEKNPQPLKVPDSAAYYSQNMYLYNFTMVRGYSTGRLSSSNAISFLSN